jgi:outer membrane lipoprotein SlyB
MKRNTTHEAIVGVAMALIIAAVALVGFFTASVVGAIVGALVGVGAIAIVGAAAAVGDWALDRRYNGTRAVDMDGEAIAIILAMGGAAVGGFFVSNALGASYTHTLAIAVASAGAVAVLVFGGYAVDEMARNRYTRNR